ncbi:enoyl-CoA hydratase/isomerase family protein [Phenylobacterium sp.]|uniref:enoyl-CoA hydratase/isomerase family protein n=1 Tax=Phenylobacterium sp. TaxID=1871053 RepID=UPI002FC70EE5
MPPPADAILAAALDPEGGEALSALGGEPLVVVSVEDSGRLRQAAASLRAGAPILVGVDEAGRTPDGVADVFDIVLTTAVQPPRPWVSVGDRGVESVLSALRGTVQGNPAAAAVFATVLRLGDQLDFEGALTLESLAYSALLGGADFRTWRAGRPVRQRPVSDTPQVRLERRDDALVITLARPEARNAVGARLRDELTQALRLARLDPSVARVELRGEGPTFSAGGDLDEFGQAADLALAHIIRTQRSPVRLADELGERLTVFVQGAAIGGGIEIAAAAASLVADPGALFRLPEVGMGLIPGAGGTASLPRRIGRHRTCFMGLSGFDIDAREALAWGLIDRLEPVR